MRNTVLIEPTAFSFGRPWLGDNENRERQKNLFGIGLETAGGGWIEILGVKFIDHRMPTLTRTEALRVLGLGETATLEEARIAYLTITKELHPDQYADKPHLRASAENTLKEVNNAWDVLKRGTWSSSGSTCEDSADHNNRQTRSEQDGDGGHGSYSSPPPEPEDEFDLDEIWRRIESVQSPGPDPQPAEISVSASPEAVAAGIVTQQHARTFYLYYWAIPSALLLLIRVEIGVWYTLIVYFVARRKYKQHTAKTAGSFQRAESEARLEYQQFQTRLKEKGSEELFLRLKREITEVRDKYLQLPKSKEEDLWQEYERLKAKHLRAFLARHVIMPGAVAGIGSARVNALLEEGFVTAEDVLNSNLYQLASVPQFGEELALRLQNWAVRISDRFEFDENSLDKEDYSRLSAVVEGYEHCKAALQSRLSNAYDDLIRTRQDIERTRQAIVPFLTPLYEKLMIAEANIAAISKPSRLYHFIAWAIVSLFWCIAGSRLTN